MKLHPSLLRLVLLMALAFLLAGILSPADAQQTVGYSGTETLINLAPGTYYLVASGAMGGGTTGGLGAQVGGRFTFSTPTVLTVIIGGTGMTGNSTQAGGGGGTFVLDGTAPVLIAGGGGGSSFGHVPGPGMATTSGTGQGGNNGQNGFGGGGGGLIGNGANGFSPGQGGESFENGGAGGTADEDGGFGGGGGGFDAGGGGGGYTGGNGSTDSAGATGGFSYIPAMATGTYGYSGFNSGNGTLVIIPVVVAAKGDAVPGVAGAQFSVADSPATDIYSEVSFKAYITGTGPKSGISGANNSGIWLYTATSSQLVARTGTTAAGTAGATLATVSDPAMCMYGGMYYAGTLKGGDATSSNNAALWFAVSGSVPTIAARKGREVTGRPGAFISSFIEFSPYDDYSVPDNSYGIPGVEFLAELTGTAAKPPSNIGLFGVDESGNLDLILTAGEFGVDSFSALGVSAGGAGQSRIDPEYGFGTLVDTETIGTGHSATKTTYADITVPDVNSFDVRPVALTGTGEYLGLQGVPDVPSAEFTKLGNPIANSNWYAAFRGTIASTSTSVKINSANNTGIWLDSYFNNVYSLVARSGDAAPGTSGTFASLQDPVIGAGTSSTGSIVSFIAALVPKGAVTPATAQGIWTTEKGPLAMVERAGDPAPGVSGATFDTFQQIVQPILGEPLFVATLKGAPAGQSTGVWAIDGFGNTNLILQTGEVYYAHGAVRTVKSINIFSSLPQVAGMTRNFSVSGNGIACLLTFTDGTWAIVSLPVPISYHPL